MELVDDCVFVPELVLVGGLFWRGATKAGAIAGISAGFAVWLYTEFLPSLAQSGSLPGGFVASGLFGIRPLTINDIPLTSQQWVWFALALSAATHLLVRNLADIGTGTGLLAFAALHLWPRALAIASDIDQVCIDVVEDNARTNGVTMGARGGELTMLDEADPQSFRVRAYESASHAISAFVGDIGALSVRHDVVDQENLPCEFASWRAERTGPVCVRDCAR